jgi:hypothetical protein
MATACTRTPEADELNLPDVMKTLDVGSQKGLTSSDSQLGLTNYPPDAPESLATGDRGEAHVSLTASLGKATSSRRFFREWSS